MARRKRDNAPSQTPQASKPGDLPEDFANKSPEELMAMADHFWRKSKILAERGSGFYKHAVGNLIPYPSFAVPSMGVDKHYRCYYNPEAVLNWIMEARNVSPSNPCPTCGAHKHDEHAYVAGVIWHESQHPLRRHPEREESFKPADRVKMNIANDLEINDDAIEFFAACHKDKRQHILLCLPDGGVSGDLCEEYDLPRNHLGEYYYLNMPDEMLNKFKNEVNCGSGGGNEPGEWEVGGNGGNSPPSNEAPGISEGGRQEIERAVARDVLAAHSRGFSALGNMLDWAKDRLPASQYNWKRELNHAMRRAVSRIFGHRKRTFSKIHKKSAAQGYRVIYPRRYSTRPKVSVVLDASGSMGGSRSKHALSEIDSIIKSLRAEISIMTADWGGSGELQKIKSLSSLTISGGGGTSMRKGIIDFLEVCDDPGVVLLVTDGETDYPTREEMKGNDLIVAVVNESRNVLDRFTPPSFARTVYIPVGEQRE